MCLDIYVVCAWCMTVLHCFPAIWDLCEGVWTMLSSNKFCLSAPALCCVFDVMVVLVLCPCCRVCFADMLDQL